MKTLLKILAVSMIATSLAGCVSIVKVDQFTGKEKGLRYSLPTNFLLVSPKADGTASYDWVNLPDPNNEYVIDTCSFMSTYTMDITITDGMLKKVASKTDDTAVVAKMLDSAQSVYTSKVKAEYDVAKEAAKKESENKAAALKAIADAKLELAQVKAVLAEYESAGTGAKPEDVLTAKVNVAKAQAKLDALLEAAKMYDGAMNAPGGSALEDGQAWGPVLFRVVQYVDGNGKNNVKLVAVDAQLGFDTGTAAAPAAPPKPKQSFKFNGSSTFESGKKVEFKLTGDIDMAEVKDEQDLHLGINVYEDAKAKITLQPDKKSVNASIPKVLPDGEYTFIISYNTKAGDGLISSDDIRFTVGDK